MWHLIWVCTVCLPFTGFQVSMSVLPYSTAILCRGRQLLWLPACFPVWQHFQRRVYCIYSSLRQGFPLSRTQVFDVPGVSQYTVASNTVRNRICYTSYLHIENTIFDHIRGYCIFWDPRNVICLCLEWLQISKSVLWDFAEFYPF